MSETHINALYDELAQAKTRLAVAQGDVDHWQTQIDARSGEVPAVESETPVAGVALPEGHKLDKNGKERDAKGHFVTKGKK